jgi:hypothetical protein
MALVHQGWDHLRAGRPLAARASWQRALRLEEDSPAAAQAIATLESAADLPAAARATYRLRTPSDPARRAAWDERLPASGGGPGAADLAAMADAFGRLAAEDPGDAAALFNRALCLAWLGSNRAAIEALGRVIELEAESAPDRAVEAGLLAEVLRPGGGAEDLADDLRFACTIDWDPADTPDLLAEFPGIQRMPTPRTPGVDPDAAPRVEVYEWLDTGAESAGRPVVLASVIVDPAARTARLSSPRVETLEQAEESLFSRLGIGDGRGRTGRAASIRREAAPLPPPFLDADVWTVRMPAGLDAAGAEERRREWVEHYYEDLWIHRPRQGLGGLSPLAAAVAAHRGDAAARARLAAVIAFREQLGRRPTAQRLYQGYPFDRLRRRLGLPPDEPDAVDPADLSCAPPWELATLDPATLDDHRLADAVASAIGSGDDAITAPLSAELLRRSVPIGGPHLIGAVSPLVRRAMASGDADAAIDRIDRARARADARAAETLETWRAEILARSDRAAEALRVYRGLVGPDARCATIALDGAETLIDNRHLDEARPLLHAALDLAREHGLRWTARRAQSLLGGAT